jgi:hypothetical protein
MEMKGIKHPGDLIRLPVGTAYCKVRSSSIMGDQISTVDISGVVLDAGRIAIFISQNEDVPSYYDVLLDGSRVAISGTHIRNAVLVQRFNDVV